MLRAPTYRFAEMYAILVSYESSTFVQSEDFLIALESLSEFNSNYDGNLVQT